MGRGITRQPLTIKNVGNQGTTLKVTITSDSPWLSVSKEEFEIEDEETIVVTIDTRSLELGKHYAGKITINSNGGSRVRKFDFTVGAGGVGDRKFITKRTLLSYVLFAIALMYAFSTIGTLTSLTILLIIAVLVITGVRLLDYSNKEVGCLIPIIFGLACLIYSAHLGLLVMLCAVAFVVSLILSETLFPYKPYWALIPFVVFVLLMIVLSILSSTEIRNKGTPKYERQKTTQRQIIYNMQQHKMQLTVRVELANIRTGPGLNYSVIKVFKKGTRLTATGYTRDKDGKTWYEVYVPGQNRMGWISYRTVNVPNY